MGFILDVTRGLALRKALGLPGEGGKGEGGEHRYVGSAVLFVTLTRLVTSRMKPIGQVSDHLALRE